MCVGTKLCKQTFLLANLDLQQADQPKLIGLDCVNATMLGYRDPNKMRYSRYVGLMIGWCLLNKEGFAISQPTYSGALGGDSRLHMRYLDELRMEERRAWKK